MQLKEKFLNKTNARIIVITRCKRMATHPSNTSPTKLIANKTYYKQNQNMNIETNISQKLTGYVKRDTFDTFYESF